MLGFPIQSKVEILGSDLVTDGVMEATTIGSDLVTDGGFAAVTAGTGFEADLLGGNGAFDTDTTGDWSGIDSTVSWENSSFMRGTFTTTNENKGFNQNNVLTAGKTYQIAFKAKSNRATTFNSIGSVNLEKGLVISNPTLTTSWQEYEFLHTASGVFVILYLTGGGSIGDYLDIDDITVKEITGELASGNLTIGKTYYISAQNGEDFTADGSPNNNIQTAFVATGTNVTLDANDKAYNIIFTNWTEGTEWAPEASAGVLTGKAQKIAGTGSDLVQDVSAAIGGCYQNIFTTTRSAGSITPDVGGTNGSAVSSSTITTTYINCGATDSNLRFEADSSFAGIVDVVSCKPVTFDSWIVGTGWGPEASSGALTNKAKKTAGTASALEQDISAIVGEYYQLIWTNDQLTVGKSINTEVGGVNGSAVTVDAATTEEILAATTGNLKFEAAADWAGTVDVVSTKKYDIEKSLGNPGLSNFGPMLEIGM